MNSLKIVYDTRFIYPAQIVEHDWSPSYTENSKWKDVKNTIGKPIQDLNSALRLLNMDLVTVSEKQLDFARDARIKVIELMFNEGFDSILDSSTYFKIILYFSIAGLNLDDREDTIYVSPDDFNYRIDMWYVFDNIYKLGIDNKTIKLSSESIKSYTIKDAHFWIEIIECYNTNNYFKPFIHSQIFIDLEDICMQTWRSRLIFSEDKKNYIELSNVNTNLFYVRCLEELRSSKSFCKQITNIHKLHSLDVFDMFTDVEYDMESIRIKSTGVIRYKGGKKKHSVNLV